jgi:3-hydroxymyristoyl/3-hydroxydecanoyl-(acyl carrier protein) dehydratase
MNAWQVVAENHPALPGHFPGNPVVPGVVLLDRVLDAVRREAGQDVRCAGFPASSFCLFVAGRGFWSS